MKDTLLMPVKLSELEAMIRNVVLSALKEHNNIPDTAEDTVFNVTELAEYLKIKKNFIYKNLDKYPRVKDRLPHTFYKSQIDQYVKEKFEKDEAKKNEIVLATESIKQTNTYIMVDEHTGFYKIGKSNSIATREHTLMSQKPTIKLVFYIKENIETTLHKVFSNKRIRGEWFALTKKDLDFIISNYETHKA